MTFQGKKNSAKNHAKVQIQLYLFRENHLKVTLKQKKVRSFGKGTDILIYCWLKNMRHKSNYSASKVVHMN